jgi:predicted lipid carrier protein YhbT
MKPPPLSPILFAGFALRPVPPAFLKPLVDLAMIAIRRRHREVFEKLETLSDSTFLIDPVDLPFAFLIRLSVPTPSVRILQQDRHSVEPTATIRGPSLVLFDLLEGRLDGDALFFSRDITVEGNAEAVVILRNALDGAEIRVVEDLLSVFGPLAGVAQGVVRNGARLFARAADDLDSLRDAFNAPLVRRCDSQAAELRELKARMSRSEIPKRATERGPNAAVEAKSARP